MLGAVPHWGAGEQGTGPAAGDINPALLAPKVQEKRNTTLS